MTNQADFGAFHSLLWGWFHSLFDGGMAAQVVSDKSDLTQIVAKGKSDANRPLCVVNFWAEWCEPCKHMNNVFQQLAKSYPAHSFLQVSFHLL